MVDIAVSEHIDFDIGKEFYNFHNSYLAQKSKSKQIIQKIKNLKFNSFKILVLKYIFTNLISRYINNKLIQYLF